MITALNHSFTTGMLSTSQCQALITPIEKKGKDKRFMKNWQPISLTHRARETPYGARNCLLRIPDIPIWCLCVVALNPGYPHMAFRILQQKTTICSLIG